ncbi:hypothetical protein SDC9_175226 [bioreactor metagenome]|uniref:L-arabinose transport system permease protein AraQ n=1 Tax=bioreactor metagenome TaxID=1076179 RepID=A0A645GPF6_9ZZZZ
MMITVFSFAFVWQWTDTYYASLFLGQKIPVLSISLQNLVSKLWATYSSMGGEMSVITPGFKSVANNTGSILVLLPLVAVYLACQRYFIQGIERTGLVG